MMDDQKYTIELLKATIERLKRLEEKVDKLLDGRRNPNTKPDPFALATAINRDFESGW